VLSVLHAHTSEASSHFKICPSEQPCNKVRPVESFSRPEPVEVVVERASVAEGSKTASDPASVPVMVSPPFEVAEAT
jgi:hypothetical protein